MALRLSLWARKPKGLQCYSLWQTCYLAPLHFHALVERLPGFAGGQAEHSPSL